MLGFIVILIVIEPFIIREVEFFDQDHDHDHDHDDLLRAHPWFLDAGFWMLDAGSRPWRLPLPHLLLSILCFLWLIPPNFSSVVRNQWLVVSGER